MRWRLILMRHAKSSWKSDAPNDHARPLNKRGRRAAPAVGRHLEQIGWVPDLIVSSDSQRTTSTCELLTAALQRPPTVRFDRTLYQGGTREIAAVIRQVDPSVQTLLLLGHNPGWSTALAHWSGQSEGLKTGDAALLEAEADSWASLADLSGVIELITIVRARAVTDGNRT